MDETVAEASRCARFNGVDAADVLAYVDATTPSESVSFEEQDGSLDVSRAHIAEVGYNVVASIERNRLSIAGHLEGPLLDFDPVVRRIMEAGPVTDPDSSETVQGGCIPWASQNVRNRDEYRARIDDWTARSNFVGDYVAGSWELADLTNDWSRCMAEAGYPDMTELTAGTDRAFDYMESVLAGTRQEQEARLLEVELALSDFDCRVETDVDRRRLAIFDAAHTAYEGGES